MAIPARYLPKNSPSLVIFLGIALVWSVALLVLLRHSSIPDEIFSLGSGHSASSSERPLILYAYKETENARQNLEFFIHQGLHGAADFVFILNGETDAAGWIPRADNVRIVERPNACYDLGAYGEVLREGGLWKKYKRFITLNASIRGPFIPPWSDKCWSDAYLERLSDDVKLVGMTVNCGPTPHVQSMIWATDQVGMELMLYPPPGASNPDMYGSDHDLVAYGGCYQDLVKAIHAEVGATALIRGAGYNVSAMMAAFENPTYIDDCKLPVDPLYDRQYFGTNIHPYETIFTKANRDIDPLLIDLMTKIHVSSQGGRSWDNCR